MPVIINEFEVEILEEEEPASRAAARDAVRPSSELSPQLARDLDHWRREREARLADD